MLNVLYFSLSVRCNLHFKRFFFFRGFIFKCSQKAFLHTKDKIRIASMHTLSNITKCLHEAFWQTWWSMERSGEVSNSSSRGSGTELTLGSGPTIFTYTEGSKDSNIQVDSIRTKKKYPSIIAQAAARATLQGESRRYYIRKLSVYRQCPRRPRPWWSTSAAGPRTKGKTKIFHK